MMVQFGGQRLEDLDRPAADGGELVDYISDYLRARKVNETARDKDEQKQIMIQELGRKITTSKNCIEILDGKPTVLQKLLDDRRACRACPAEIVEQILRYQPKSILAISQSTGEVLLVLAMGDRELLHVAEAMIKVLEEEQKVDTTKPLLRSDWVGEKLVKAAFDFKKRDDKMLPLPIGLIERLIALSEPALLMLPCDNLLPLHQAVHYNVCIEEPQGALGLVRKILDKCEECIAVAVDSKATLIVDSTLQVKRQVPAGSSVYQWHIKTREMVRERRAEVASVNGRGHVTSVTDTAMTAAGNNIIDQWKKGGMIKFGNIAKDTGSSVKNIDGTAGGKKVRTKPDLKDDLKPERHTSPEEPLNPTPRRVNTLTKLSAAVSGMDIEHLSAAEAASKDILDELALRFLRWTLPSAQVRSNATKTDGDIRAQTALVTTTGSAESDTLVTDANSFFGRKAKDMQKYWFVMEMHKKYPLLREDPVRNYFQHHKYSTTLQFVVLCELKIELSPKPGPKRYPDQLFFLQWLREAKGVTKIIKLTVDDRREPHRDEDIEQVVGGWDDSDPKKPGTNTAASFDVEILDWRKADLCPVTIKRAAPNVRELHLHWSGSNSVLFGWSDASCLASLPRLRKIHVHYTISSTRSSRAQKNMEMFKRRIRLSRNLCQNDAIKKGKFLPGQFGEILVEDLETQTGGNDAPPAGSGANGSGPEKKKENEDQWFKAVRQFVRLVPPHPSPEEYKPVRVALIDDGVDIFSEKLVTHSSSFHPGDSFDTAIDGPGPEHTSVSGHGTVMADCILRMCPHAIIVPIRLMMNADYDGFTPRPEPMSAAKAIELAIEADVDIISMSWTIPSAETANNAQSLNKLGSVISEAKTRGLKIPLMFCSSVDGVLQSEDQIKSYPREMSHDLFVIGAAHSETGEMLAKVQQTKHNQVHFGVPGVDLDDLSVTTDMQAENRAALMSHMQKGKTGSSIATAFAAGIAALLIHCMQLGLYYTAEKGKKGETVDDVLRLTPASSKKYDLRVFRNMHTALGKLSLPSKNKDKFLSPSEQFQVARDGLVVYQQSPGGVVSRVPDSLAPIATMIRSLVS